MKPTNSKAASKRETEPSRHITVRAIEAATAKGMSFRTVFLLMIMGATMAVIPTISNVLKTFDPTTFPTAISDVPLIADISDTKNSGIEVPIATTVSPITIWGTFIRCAKAVAPSVRRSAPQRTSIAPKRIKRILITPAKLRINERKAKFLHKKGANTLAPS